MAATPRKITTGKKTKWLMEVCVRGVRKSKRFDTKNEALNWGMEQEALYACGDKLIHGKTVADAMDRYAREVSPTKNGERWECVRLDKFARDEIANIRLTDLRLEDAESFRDRAIEKGLRPATITREMNLLKPVIRQAVKWGYLEKYPWADYENPKQEPPRDRTITDDEISAMTISLGLVDSDGSYKVPNQKQQQVGVLFLLALETGMRLGEMCAIKWEHVDLTSSTVHLPAKTTKTNVKRTVPLSTEATELFKLMRTSHTTTCDTGSVLQFKSHGRVFEVSASSASAIFLKHRKRSELGGFTFHDSRHTAITRLAELVDVLELQRITGHKDINELITYYNKSAADISVKINENKKRKQC